ncbi:MAG: hypothetical protein U0235_33270 [Polyangiaceae bacterium]
MPKKDIDLDELDKVSGGVSARWLHGHGVQGGGGLNTGLGGHSSFGDHFGGSPTIDPHAQIPAGTMPGHYPTGAGHGPYGTGAHPNGSHQSETGQIITAAAAALPRIIDAFTGHGSQGRGNGSGGLLSSLFGNGNGNGHASSSVGGGPYAGSGHNGFQGGPQAPQPDGAAGFGGSQPGGGDFAPHGPAGSGGGAPHLGPAGATGGGPSGGEGSAWGEEQGGGSAWGQEPAGGGSAWGQEPAAANGGANDPVYGPPAPEANHDDVYGPPYTPGAPSGGYEGDAFSAAPTPEPASGGDLGDLGDLGGGFNPMGDFTGF